MPLSIDPLAIQPVSPALAAIAADLGVALQPGTVVDARVLAVLDANLVRVAIASLTMDVPTARPLQQGQILQLAVAQTADGLTLTPVASDAAAMARAPAVQFDKLPLMSRGSAPPLQPALTPLESETITAAAQSAVTKQAGLAPLFADLAAATPSGKLPQPVLAAAAQLLGLRLQGHAAPTGSDLKAAFQASGLLMEATMTGSETPPVPDMKAALLVLRQALVASLAPSSLPTASGSGQNGQTAGPVTDPQQPADVPSADIKTAPASAPPAPANASAAKPFTPSALAAGLGPTQPQPIPQMASSLSPTLDKGLDLPEPAVLVQTPAGAQRLTQTLRSFARLDGQSPSQPVPPPVRGAPPVAQAISAPSVAPEMMEPDTLARHLMAETDGAIARQTLLQIASLPDRADTPLLRNDPLQQRWNFEIPFVVPQGTAMAQFEIARDGVGVETETAQRIWRARFSIDIEPAGPIHALIAFGGETTSVKMWAERPATATRLRANVAELTHSLGRAALKTGDIMVVEGAPTSGTVAAPGHFLNRAT